MSDPEITWRAIRDQRPPVVRLLLFYAAFILAAGFGQWLAIIPGISITLWPPNGVYIAALLLNRRPAWPYFIACGLLAELTCNALWFHNQIGFAVAYNAANAIESVIAAWFLGSFFPPPARFRTLRQVVAFALVGVLCAPLVAATIGSTIDAATGKHAFGTAWLLWWLGDATGVLIAAPLTLVIAETWRRPPRLSGAAAAEVAAIGVAILGLGTWTLSGNLPFAYIILPPLLWAAVRFEFRGATFSSVLLALLVAVSTVAGLSPFADAAEGTARLHVMMQLFLAVSAIMGLVVAATSRQRRHALLTLQAANEDLERRVDERTAELRENQGFVESILATAPHAVYILDIVDRRFVYRSREVSAELGYSPEEMARLGPDPLQRILHPEDWLRLDELLGRWRTAADDDVLETEIRQRRKDGSVVWRLIREKVFMRGEDGTVRQIIGASQDITERKLAEERERLLMLEVNHRAKNMLALVQAIARQTAAGDPAEFADRFARRIQSLASSHDLLVKSGWREIPLDELVRLQLAPLTDQQGDRITLAGPEMSITAAAAQTIGMALHELATNAVKYGSLSTDLGRVRIEWEIGPGEGSDGPDFMIRWTETGGPAAAPPKRRGFGSTVIDNVVRMSLDAEVGLDYAPAGLAWRVACPLARVTGASAGGEADPAHVVAWPSATATQPRVLVVEDEPLIALDIVTTLVDAGFEVIGPAASVATALDLIHRYGCDVAVLDINLGSETAEPVAALLASMELPFMSISGYAPKQRPPGFEDTPHLGKPLRPELLIAEVNRCLGRAAA